MFRLPFNAANLLLGLSMCCMPLISTAGLTAAEIVNKSNEIEGGDDSISRLAFTFQKPDGSEKKLVYTMVWKEYAGRNGVDDKMIFFSEYPPDDNGKSYMIWVNENKQDDEWMYLPELRMVRKVTHDESHHHSDKEDDFAHSVLTQVNLVPRDPGLDDHTLLKDEELDGHNDYVVESVPKRPSKNYPYQKIRRWITQDNFLPERIDYYGESGAVEKRQTTRWKKIGSDWVWEQVAGEDLKSHNRTVLDITDIRLNSGLKDDIFSERTMRLGKDSIAR